MSHTNDRLVQKLALERTGLLTRAGSGLEPRLLERRAVPGWLTRPHRGVYRLAGTPNDELHAIRAAAAAAQGAAMSRRSALVLRGLWDPKSKPEIVHVATAPGLRVRRPGIRSHELRNFCETDVVLADGIRCLGWPCLLIECATWMRPSTLERTIDDALLRRWVTVGEIRTRFATVHRSGTRGAGVLNALLLERDDGSAKTSSVLEQRFARLLGDAGLPRPLQQFGVVDATGRTRFLDFAYPDERLAIETDGWRYHASRQDWSADQTRNNDLVAIGWRFLRVTVHDLDHRPDRIVASIRAALRR